MKPVFIQYPPCGTCRKARMWLEAHGIEYTGRSIVENNPTVAELEAWIPRSGLPLKKFFNTSGVLYKELNLKEKLPQLTEREQIELLASDGKLVKRPLLVLPDKVLVGFNEQEWEAYLSNKPSGLHC